MAHKYAQDVPDSLSSVDLTQEAAEQRLESYTESPKAKAGFIEQDYGKPSAMGGQAAEQQECHPGAPRVPKEITHPHPC